MVTKEKKRNLEERVDGFQPCSCYFSLDANLTTQAQLLEHQFTLTQA